jgi:hypothetical protein
VNLCLRELESDRVKFLPAGRHGALIFLLLFVSRQKKVIELPQQHHLLHLTEFTCTPWRISDLYPIEVNATR